MISTIPQITDAGRALILRAIAGETLTFTRLAIGSGFLEDGQDQDELIRLIHEELSITPASLDKSQKGLLAITGDFTSADVKTDIVWRELGVYAQGEDGIELLYAYANDGDGAGTLKAITPSSLVEEKITVIVEVDGVENVTAIYNPHVQYAEAVVLNGHMNNKKNPHGVTKDQVGLGNVPNKSPENVTVEFNEAIERANIVSGEKMSVMLGKIAKVITDTIAHITKTSGNPHRVSKSDVGLGNVVNKTPSDMEIDFTEASENKEELNGAKDLFSGSTAFTLFTRIAAAVHAMTAHIGTTDGNPHHVSKKDVGLGNVENTSPSFNVVRFDPRNQYGIPESGETMATMMSKVAKDLTDVQTHMDAEKSENPHGINIGKIAAVGVYVGDGLQGRVVPLPFAPSAIQLWDEFGRTYAEGKGICGGMALHDRGIRVPNSENLTDATTWSNNYTALMCTEDGFKVNFVTGATTEDSICTNESGVAYHYVAYQ